MKHTNINKWKKRVENQIKIQKNIYNSRARSKIQDFEECLRNNSEFIEKIKNPVFAIDCYRALCNMKWQEIWTQNDRILHRLAYIHRRLNNNVGYFKNIYRCTWRYAGGLIAELRNQNEDYVDFYCSGGEGMVSEEVKKIFKKIGWEPLPYKD